MLFRSVLDITNYSTFTTGGIVLRTGAGLERLKVWSGGNITTNSSGSFTLGTVVGTGTQALFAGAITASSSITATSFIKSGGTSSQYLMADGSTTTGTPTTTASGQYTPTISTTTNVASNTQTGATYLRVGNAVTVSGYMTITPTASSTPTLFAISLPISSALSNGAKDGNGVFAASPGASNYIQGGIYSGSGLISFSFLPTSTSTYAIEYHFTYFIN